MSSVLPDIQHESFTAERLEGDLNQSGLSLVRQQLGMIIEAVQVHRWQITGQQKIQYRLELQLQTHVSRFQEVNPNVGESWYNTIKLVTGKQKEHALSKEIQIQFLKHLVVLDRKKKKRSGSWICNLCFGIIHEAITYPWLFPKTPAYLVHFFLFRTKMFLSKWGCQIHFYVCFFFNSSIAFHRYMCVFYT